MGEHSSAELEIINITQKLLDGISKGDYKLYTEASKQFLY